MHNYLINYRHYDKSDEEAEQIELIKLEHQLSSSRHIIEQLEKELQLKNSKIAEMEDNVLSRRMNNSLM